MSAPYLSRRVYCQVREGLAVGFEIATLAAELGLSEETIFGIADGSIQPSRLIVEDEDPLREQMLTATRCPECGAMVYVWPCLACEMAARAKGKLPKSSRVGGRNLKHKRRRLAAKRAAA